MHFTVGQKVVHPEHGEAVVRFVGEDRVGLEFADGQQGLFKKESFDLQPPEIPTPETEEERRHLPWPQSTFVHENQDAEHYPGAHWQPFMDDVKEILERLPDLLQSASEKNALGLILKPDRPLPAEWAKGFVLAWPSSQEGIAIGCRTTSNSNELVTLFPFTRQGTQHRLTVTEVRVWEDGLTAQIVALFGDAELAFFDTDFVANRGWYEAGQPQEFILSGFAYSAQPSTNFEVPFSPPLDVIAWQNQLAEQEGDKLLKKPEVLCLKGIAMLIPIADGDVDEYNFRGETLQVEPFSKMLGQNGWRVKVRVVRDGSEDLNLDIWITEKIWQGDTPPKEGEDIEGVLWLQGYLWDTLPMDDDEH